MRRLMRLFREYSARQDALLAAAVEANVLAARALAFVASDRLRAARQGHGHHHHGHHGQHGHGNASLPGGCS